MYVCVCVCVRVCARARLIKCDQVEQEAFFIYSEQVDRSQTKKKKKILVGSHTLKFRN
jgi:hypothetical protein